MPAVAGEGLPLLHEFTGSGKNLHLFTSAGKTIAQKIREHTHHVLKNQLPAMRSTLQSVSITTDTDEQPVNLPYSLATPRHCCNQSLLLVTATANVTPEIPPVTVIVKRWSVFSPTSVIQMFSPPCRVCRTR